MALHRRALPVHLPPTTGKASMRSARRNPLIEISGQELAQSAKDRRAGT
jgi:hypothetical protein